MDEDMDELRESLEVLISSLTSSKGSIMPKAMEVVSMLEKTPHAIPIAVRLMANKIQSAKEEESMHALALLDLCMKECGANFQAEVGKFRFLNELIKLVSPKYLGGRTPPLVRQKVLTLLYVWTKDYSHETKILEAYEMLKKQGVVSKDDPVSDSPKCEGLTAAASRSKSIFEDDERSRLLQKLLQSKNPDDLQAANRLIKTMVKEDERRAELNARRRIELESVRNNAKLLCEMLESFRPGRTSSEEFELIKEVHQSCERLQTVVIRLASETQDNEKMMEEVLNASDLLAGALDKYTLVIERGVLVNSPNKTDSLLDLTTPSEERLPVAPVAWLHDELQDLDLDKKLSSPADTAQQSSLEVLGDIFGPLAPNESSAAAASVAAPIVHAEPTILQPVSLLLSTGKKEAAAAEPEKEQRPRGLSDLDLLGEIMLKDNLPPSHRHQSSFSRTPMKIPMNMLGKSQDTSPSEASASVDIKVLEEKVQCIEIDVFAKTGRILKKSSTSKTFEEINGDDRMVDISDSSVEPPVAISESECAATVNENQSTCEAVIEYDLRVAGNTLSKSGSDHDSKRVEVKSLADVFVSLDSIKPGSIPPHPILDEQKGLSVVLHFAKDAPRPDVSVIVVTTINRNTEPITSFLFQAVVPKTCKLRLLPPSGSDLPAHNPFLPPSAITQVMLIANPNKDPVSLKYMISYTLDGEMTTEMGEVEKLPLAT